MLIKSTNFHYAQKTPYDRDVKSIKNTKKRSGKYLIAITKQEAKEISNKCLNVSIYRTQKSKSKRGIFYIQERIMFTDIHSDIINLQNLIDAYECIKGNDEVEIIKYKLKGALKYKQSFLK